MAAGRATGNRDDSARLPTLSLGLSSVRLIVNKLEAEYARATASSTFETGRELIKYDPNIDEGYDNYHDSPFVQSRGQVWNRFAANIGVALSRCIPSVTFGNFGVLAVTTGLLAPRMISYLLVYPFCRLVFGTLYPAYASYKAVRTKNLKEYVKWMMYWIVFALFTCTETFTDVFLSWFPFYYEVKIVLVLWLLSPATKGSSILYRKFVHPALCRREQEIDEYIAKAKDQGYHTVLNLGTKGVNYATTVIMQTAIKGGGGLVQQLRKSYSLSDLTECEPREERGSDEADDVLAEPRLIRRGGKSGYVTRRSASESNNRSPMYFPEVDVDVRPRPRSDEPDFSHVKSSEDISSGYSSADASAPLARAASLRRARVPRPAAAALTAIKRPQAAEGSEVIVEELQDDDSLEYSNMPPLINLPSPLFLSHTQPPFIYQYVGDQVKILQVLGNYPLNINSNNQNNNTDHWDQKEPNSKEAPSMKHAENITEISELPQEKAVSKETDDISNIPVGSQLSDNNDNQSYLDAIDIVDTLSPSIDKESVENDDVTKKGLAAIVLDANLETTNLDTSLNDIESVEGDDEASFGTPENSPKSKRKSPKGKYGKPKAPQPPLCHEGDEITDGNKEAFKTSDDTDILEGTSQESLVDIVNNLPNITFKESGLFKGLQVVSPIAENKRRHKSKSPGRILKENSSGLGKLLQLPGRLAFWHKNDDKLKADDVATLSGDHSRRSSTVERADDFQSCTELNTIALNDSNISSEEPHGLMTDILFLQESADGNKNITQGILEKSDALQKLIDAKIESHPEYKFISLHEENQTPSKSTDV